MREPPALELGRTALEQWRFGVAGEPGVATPMSALRQLNATRDSAAIRQASVEAELE